MAEKDESIDLLAQLNQATDDAERQASATMKPDEEAIEKMINSEIAIELEEEPEPAKEEPKTESEIPKQEPEPSGVSKDQAERMAQRFVRGASALLKITMPGLYRRKILHKGDQQTVAEYMRNKEDLHRQGIEDFSGIDDKTYQACLRYQKLEKAINDLDFSKEEKDLIIQDLTEVIPRHKWMQMSPESSLFWTVAMIMLPRIEPLFPGIHKFFDKLGGKE